MSGLRSFVTGTDACAPDDGAGPSNAAAAFADAFLGRSKQQQQLQELPGFSEASTSTSVLPYTPPSAAEAAETAINADLPAIGGIFDNGRASHLVNEFENFAQKPSVYQPTRNVVGHSVDDLAREFEYAFKHGASKNDLFGDEILLSAARSEVLRPSLSAFLKGDIPDVGSRGSLGAVRGDIPGDFNLSISDKCKLRDRSTILARQVFSDQGSEFADAHVHKLLNSLRIDPEVLPASLDLPSTSTWNDIYGNAHVTSNLSHGVSSSFGINHAVEAAGAAAESRKHQKSLSKKIDGWADDYSRGIEAATDGQSSWASEFLADEKSLKNSWINEFESTAAIGSASKLNVESQDTLSQTRRLAETLKADTSQKFQNSKFLQFLSKMSRGELIMEDNAVKEVKPKIVQWANEFDSLNQNAKQHSLEGNGDTGMNSWAAEFSSKSEDQLQAENISQWAEEFNLRTGTMADDWIEQFEEGVGKDNATDLAAAWEEEYLAELERLHGVEGPESSVGYAMTENNPFLDDFDSFAKGKDLFRRGLLSEAILALEAECQRQPGNNEAWRLLGTVQAEADDDVQAIAALNRAIGANPGDLDALLSLGVSYTNELEQRAATRYLWDWLKKHPSHSNIANAALESHLADSSQEVASIIRAFESAAIESPQDKDVHAALGVLYNLARRYDDAIAAFQAALAVQSQDYSLWNKLGATLANSGRSNEAISAYQEAINLKPNYMRAWTNMGISYANLGNYDASVENYVRALALNRNAGAVWGYLKTSISCADRTDLMSMAEKEDLDGLMKVLLNA